MPNRKRNSRPIVLPGVVFALIKNIHAISIQICAFSLDNSSLFNISVQRKVLTRNNNIWSSIIKNQTMHYTSDHFFQQTRKTHASTQHKNPNSAIQPTNGTLPSAKPTTTEVQTITKRYADVAMDRSKLV